MKRILLGIAFSLMASSALAQNCSGYPYDLTNGQTADANQVMANFNAILACANSQLAHNGVNSDITQLLSVTNLAFAPANSNITSITGLTTPLSVPQGGTGANNASSARTNLGLGTSAIENLLGDVIDDGSGNLTVGNSGVVAGPYTNPTISISADGRITSASSGSGPASVATVRAWVTFNDVSGTITVFSAYNVSGVTRVAAGDYKIQTSGGVSFSGGGLVCSASETTAPPLVCQMNGNAITGLNPDPEIFTIDPGVGAVNASNIVSAIIVGAS